MGVLNIGRDVAEYNRTLVWYTHKKLLAFGQYFETGKGLVAEILKARRGTYQLPFLRVGVVFLAAAALLSTPIIINHYPTSAFSTGATSAISASTVLGAATDITNVDTTTTESEKPRRDVVEYTVKGGDTLSSIAKAYGVDADSVAYLNDITTDKVLVPGETIKIPPVSGVIVKVKRGETIFALAKKYGLPSPQPIVDWPYNNFVNDEKFTLAAGQVLVIPGGKPPEEVPVAPVVVKTPALFAGGTGQFSWPVGGIITQYFSWYHHGIDIANSVGTAVTAADSGRVVSVLYESFGYGYHLIIDHGNGYRTLYGHLSKIVVAEGDNVSRGQLVGLMGSTGRSTGSHLHFEIHQQGGAVVNPLGFLK